MSRLLTAGAALWITLMVVVALSGPAAAITPPGTPDPRDVPAVGSPKSEFPMRRSNKACGVAQSRLSGAELRQRPPALQLLDIDRAHTLSTGKGVTVAVIDTGVTKGPRLPNVTGGGDFVGDGAGLADCDAHGTLVAGIIGAAPSADDGMVGVAPDAKIISIRQHSDAYSLQLPNGANSEDPENSQNAVDLRALARAVVHAARQGANVINISVTACMSAASEVSTKRLAAALWWAANVKDVVIVAAAGNSGDRQGCTQNPDVTLADPTDSRNWGGVTTVSMPSVFTRDVVSVGFTSADGEPSPNSLRGPWVDLGAPGIGVVSVGPEGGVVDAVMENRGLTAVAGSSFAAAYVSGVAALIRSRYPELDHAQVIARMVNQAHSPARGVDNTIGYGLVDPVAALLNTGDSGPPPQLKDNASAREMVMPVAAPGPSRAPQLVAAWGSLAVIAVAGVVAGVIGVRRRRSHE